jgi:hypothetical protein
MGLLDDAIRDHLHLRRLRGVDPGGVAREEREALGPAPRVKEGLATERGRARGSALAAAIYDAERSGPFLLRDASSASEETVEIDMQAVFQGAVAQARG